MNTHVVVFVEGKCSLHLGIDEEARLVCPRACDIAHCVATSTKHQSRQVETLDKLDAVGVAVHAQVEAAETVARQAIATALQHDRIGLVVLHDAGYNGFEDGLV